ncbi:hypothetical protein PAJ34TS1_56130 [Paenibacillus azoreducens]|uniref:Uncharacterized protein n=1 Tax=Paenibacillus azoreducens TaxID=116718 RepID=A0A919YCJ5_9BACL|nr:hypothetical protein J34TS1_19780 [Paenibacillus azoreducens]
MNDLQYVYCLCCERMVPVSDTMVIFRTGYYRTTVPLGYCEDCHNQGEEERRYQYMELLKNGYATMR